MIITHLIILAVLGLVYWNQQKLRSQICDVPKKIIEPNRIGGRQQPAIDLAAMIEDSDYGSYESRGVSKGGRY